MAGSEKVPYNTFIAREDDDNRRFDRVIRKAFEDIPLSLIYQGIRKGLIRLNGKRVEGSIRISRGDVIEISSDLSIDTASGKGTRAFKNLRRDSSGPPLEILHETSDLLFVNKPSGVLTHGKSSVEGAACLYLTDKTADSLSFRPGVLHRLDRNTSGILTFGKSLKGARIFSDCLKNTLLRKYYIGVIEGELTQKMVWRDPLLRVREVTKISREGKESITEVTPLIHSRGFSLVEFRILTGRTHQIRAQSAYHGFPLAGDRKYGADRRPPAGNWNGYLLHAYRLELPEELLPCSGIRVIIAPLSSRDRKKLSLLFPAKSLAMAYSRFKSYT